MTSHFFQYMHFEELVLGIKNLEIQGAENIARAGLYGILLYLVDNYKDLTRFDAGIEFSQARGFLNKPIKELISSRPTEPMLRNVIKFLLFSLQKIFPEKPINAKNFVTVVKSVVNMVFDYLEKADQAIYSQGSRKIKNGMIVFTHCHSSTVVGILKRAKAQGKNFVVYNTETRPRFQGRITAKELADSGIKVRHFVDAAARLALKKADIFLFGADAITADGKVVNKIGTEMFCEIAKNFDVPRYSCANSLKFDFDTVFGFDEPIEERSWEEVWPDKPDLVEIDNHAFEIVDKYNVSGIISEIGVYSPDVFISTIIEKFPWIKIGFDL